MGHTNSAMTDHFSLFSPIFLQEDREGSDDHLTFYPLVYSESTFHLNADFKKDFSYSFRPMLFSDCLATTAVGICFDNWLRSDSPSLFSKQHPDHPLQRSAAWRRAGAKCWCCAQGQADLPPDLMWPLSTLSLAPATGRFRIPLSHSWTSSLI